MKQNKNFAHYISEQEIEYAPSSFDENGGKILNPSEQMYISRGWYKVINVIPEADENCYVKFSGYSKDDEQKTITFNYVQQMIPVEKETHQISKLYLEIALTKMGLIDQFFAYLDSNEIDLGDGVKMSSRNAYDKCLIIDDGDPLFEPELKKAREYFQLDDETYRKIIEFATVKN